MPQLVPAYIVPTIPKFFAELNDLEPISLKPCFTCCRQFIPCRACCAGFKAFGTSYDICPKVY